MAITLDGLVAGIREACGADVVGVVLYGSTAATDAPDAKDGDEHDVLVLVRQVHTAGLRALSHVVRRWIGAGHPPPLVLTVAEWQTSGDVFAIEYADLLARHRVLFGALPTDGVRVKRSDIRRQLETEAMGKLLRLRRGVMAAGDDAKMRRALLDDALPSMLALFRATVRLHDEAVPASAEALCDRAAMIAGFSATDFHAVLAYRRGTRRVDDGVVEQGLRGYHDALEKLVAHVDGYAVPD